MKYDIKLATKLRIIEEPDFLTHDEVINDIGGNTFYAPAGLTVLEASIQRLIVRTWHELAYRTCSFGDGNVLGLVAGGALRKAVEAKLGTDDYDIAEIMEAMEYEGSLTRSPGGWAHSEAWETPDYWHLEESSKTYCDQWRPGEECWLLDEAYAAVVDQ